MHIIHTYIHTGRSSRTHHGDRPRPIHCHARKRATRFQPMLRLNARARRRSQRWRDPGLATRREHAPRRTSDSWKGYIGGLATVLRFRGARRQSEILDRHLWQFRHSYTAGRVGEIFRGIRGASGVCLSVFLSVCLVSVFCCLCVLLELEEPQVSVCLSVCLVSVFCCLCVLLELEDFQVSVCLYICMSVCLVCIFCCLCVPLKLGNLSHLHLCACVKQRFEATSRLSKHLTNVLAHTYTIS
jgi:hypothetical protein